MVKRLAITIAVALVLLIVPVFTIIGYAAFVPTEDWNVVYDTGIVDHAYDVAMDSQGNIIVTGYNQTNPDFITVKYHPNGSQMWNVSFDGGSGDYGQGVAVDSQDNILVLGRSMISTDDFMLVKYYPNGTMIWSNAYDSGASDYPSGLTVDSQDNIIMVGQTSMDFFTIKVSSSGTHLWNRTFNISDANEGAYDVATDSQDNVIVAGQAEPPASGNKDISIVKYDKDGNQIWNLTTDNGGTEEARGVSVDSRDNIIVAGYNSTTGLDYFTAKYDKDGNQLWNVSYPGSFGDVANAVAVDLLDNIIVTGYSYNLITASNDFFTIAYDRNGAYLWNRTYDSGGSDTARGVAVYYDNITVTGSNQTNADFITVKYYYNYTNIPPGHYPPLLNATTIGNTTKDNLTVWNQSTADINKGSSVTNVYTWYKTGRGTMLNMPLDLNETSNATGAIRDYSRYGNNGALGGGTDSKKPVWTGSGARGGAYIFDGTNDYISVPDSDSLDLGGEFSIEGWFKPNRPYNTSADFYQGLLDKGSYEVYLDKSDGRLKFSLDSDVAKSWSTLGTGMNNMIYALAAWNGSLYAGGQFTTAGGNTANYIARWNGTGWSPLGTGMDNVVYSLVVFNGSLYAGGAFTTAGGNTANRVARWDGNSWSAVGSGMNSQVTTLAVLNGSLFAGGFFTTAGGVSVTYIARWDGTSWNSLGSSLNGFVWSLGAWNGDLYVGGSFTTVGALTVNRIARWRGGTLWNAVGTGLNSIPYSITEWNGDLYVGGLFTTAGGNSANYIARWNGTGWSPLDTGLDSTVYGISEWRGDLYATGGFSSAGSATANRVARWDGTSWSAVGSGFDNTGWTLATWKGGLYVGGAFTTAGGNTANRIAKWSNGNESEIGSATTNWPPQWHHFAVIHNSTELKLYINGALESTVNSSAVPPSNTKPLLVGKEFGSREGGYAGSGPEHFDGAIDEIRIYDMTLSPEQVSANYNGGAPKYDVMVSGQTRICDICQADVTPHDGEEDGATLSSNFLIIEPMTPFAPNALNVTTVNASCPSGYTDVLHLSNFLNAHVELANNTNYDINVCVSNIMGQITTNATTGFNFLDLSGETNAHVELPFQGNYPYEAYISSDPMDIYCCAYPETYGSCPQDRACLVTVSSNISGGYTNMHVANCTDGNAYSTSICCGIAMNPWTNVTFPEGVYEPYATGLAGMHKFTFNITFHNLTAASGQNLECQIRRSDGSVFPLNETLSSSVTSRDYNLQYTLKSSDPIDKTIPWLVQNCTLYSSEGGSVIYTNSSYYNRPAWLANKIFVHGNTWSQFSTTGDDAYRALDCFLQFDKVYFNNTYRCDYSGDVAFSVAMAQGSTIEGWCHDSQDNDGNTLVDCNDQYCGGITYSCMPHTPVDDPFGGTCSNGICWETKTVGGHSITYYYTRYVKPGGTLKFRFDGGSYSTSQPISFALSNMTYGFTSYGKYAAPGSHNLTSDQIAQSGGQNVTYKTEDASGYTGDIDMVMYVNISNGWSDGTHKIDISITQYGSNLIIYDIPIVINSTDSPINWNESDQMTGVIAYTCNDTVDNDLDYYPNCADQDCDRFIGGTNCTGGSAYCEYGLELTCYDCFNNDAEDGYDCAEAECDLKPGDYQNLSTLCEYQEGAGYSNATHESFYPWKTACQDMFDNDQDAASPYAPLLNIDCCDTTVCWQKGGLNTDISNYPCPSKENNSALWCFDGIDNDYDDGSNNADCDANSGRDCRDYDCRGMTNTTHTCPTNEAINQTGQFNASQCFDNIDNDLDNPSMTYTGPAANIDCADIDCLGVANPLNPNQVCYPYEFNFTQHYQFCADSYDNDGDAYAGWPTGGTDCTDPDCNKQFDYCGPCPAYENYTWDSCADGIDNDHTMPTGITDCSDTDCLGEIGSTLSGERCEYGTETSCFDGFNNDADSYTDCADVDCNNTGPCETGLELTCNDGKDNDADTYYDCVDTNCYGVGTCSPKLWSTVSCLTVPYTTTPSSLGGTSIQVGHLERHYVYTNYTVRIMSAATYGTIQIILGNANDASRYFPYNISNCTMTGTNAYKLIFTPTSDVSGRIDHNPGYVNATDPMSGFDITLNCGGNESPQSKTYSITVTSSWHDGTPDNGAGTRSPTVYENTPPSVLRIEAGPVDSTDGINIPYGGRIRYRANVTNDPSGICQCQFDLDSGSFPSTDGDCTYYTTYTQDDTSYTVQARARDGANNLGSYGGSRTFQINVMPIATDADLNKTEPFFYSTEDIGFGASFQTSSDGSFPGSCNAYVEDSTGSVVWSGTLTKTSLGSGAVECNGTIPAPNSDNMYKAYVNITDEDGDTVSSYKKVFYVCDSLTSSGTGWTCARADFDQDGWTEGVTISMYGTGFVCDMCPNQVNTGRDDDADGFDNACDISCGVYNTKVTMIQDLNVTGDCFIINASNVTFDCSGFTLRGNGTGIAINITGQEGVTIFNCTIENFFDGIYASDSNRSNMLMNTLYNNSDYGIWIEGTSSVSHYNNITGNFFNENLEGALLDRSLYSTVYNNTFSRNLFGIELVYANFSTVSLNAFDNNTDFWSGTTYSYAGFAVTDSDSMNNTYTNNTFRYNNVSVLSGGSHDNIISHNRIYNSTLYGIYFVESGANNNTVYSNTFLDNWVGVNITGSSSGNVLYFNNFSRSVFVHAGSVSGNSFNRTNPSKLPGYTAEGNTWDDLGSLQIYDTNLDTFGDTGAQYPYSAANGANVTGYVADWGPYPANITMVTAWLNISLPEGVYEPYNATVPGTHKFDFNITFHNFTSLAGNILECEIEMSNGSVLYLSKTISGSVTNGQEYLNYNLSFSDSVNKTVPWWVHNCSLYTSGRALLYTNSSDYGREPWLAKKIFVHGNTWTRFDNIGDDAYRALDCFLQFDKVYFNNTYRCDYSGDVAFSVAMSRGVNIEGWCHDSLDNDLNSLIDCSDQYCGGITYSCLNHTPVDDPFGGTCSNGICWETKTVGGHATTYYYTRYVKPGGTLKFRFDGGSYSTSQPIAFALTDLASGFVSYGKYAAPGSHNLTDDQIAQSGGVNVTYKTEDASGYTGDIDMVMYVNLTNGWSAGEHNITVSITQYGANLIIYDVPIIISSSAPSNWNETEEMSGVISAPCSDPAVSGYVPDNDLDFYPNCADQDCDRFIGGTNCTAGSAYCQYGKELTCYDCFDNDADTYIDCDDSDCDLRPGDYQNLTILCEYQEGAGYSNATHESFYPWRTACSDLFDNDGDASSRYGPLLNIDCCDTTVCWQKGGTSTTDPCPRYENNTANNTVGSWCHDGIDNDYDDGSNNADCSATTGRDCRDYDCRGVSNTTHTCPVDERMTATGQVNNSQCFDNVDNDLDNPSMTYIGPAANIDCADIDCLGVANPLNPNQVCYPQEFNLTQNYQFCNNNYDDDGDNSFGWPNGGTDCTDPDCNKKFGSCGPCPSEENITWDSCADSIDNDHTMPTGITDCADTDCLGEIGSTASGQVCQATETSCFDGFDNDADSYTDCADVNCNNTGWCQTGKELSCTDERDNDADGYYDCADSDCYGVGACSSQGWSTTSCITVPYTTTPSSVGGTTLSVGHLERHYVYTNYTVRLVGSGSYNSVSIILGDATDPTRYFPYDARNCSMSGTNANKLKYVSTQAQVGRIDHDPLQVGAGNPLNGFDVTLNCGGVSAPQPKTYSISITNSLYDGSPDNGAGTRSPTVYENTPPTVSSIEAGPLSAGNVANIIYGGTVRYRAIPSSDPSGICRCAFSLDGTIVQSSDGNCLYSTTYTDDDTSYQLAANATDGAANTGPNGGSRTIAINVKPISTATSINMTEPFYRSTDGVLFGASFRTASSGNFAAATCSAYIEDSTGSVVWSGTLVKTGGSGSTVECNGTVPAPNTDGLYKVYVNVTDEDSDQVSSGKKVFYVCDSLTSSGTGWTCAKADFDQDGWTEGVNTTLYGDPNMVCDMCPGQVNTGLDDDADGIDNVCDTQATSLSIWDSGDPAGGGQTLRVGQTIGFYANYTSQGSELLGATCRISFGGADYSMTYSIPTKLYTYSNSFSSSGTYNWNVTCQQGGYQPKSASDSFTILGAAVGNVTISLTINNTNNVVYVPGLGQRPASQIGTVWNSPPHYYFASYANNVLYGLVFAYQTPSFLRFTRTSTSHTMTIALEKENSMVLLAFTRGDWRAIEEKIRLIETHEFFKKISPSFGYGLGLYSTIKSLLDYRNVDVQSDLVLNPGTHKIVIESNRTDSQKAVVIRRE